ncbi:hypothetical protein BDD14_3443 [Edaphobacter modestus]|uniref:Uncharacterized protein n=1 Tax=Edaphobacter modestus TaxID=388466 RepID=A0A4Q7YXG1_9BACT|nr:hypothetical protein BDD14_3443 [Edaphobacter modestus]
MRLGCGTGRQIVGLASEEPNLILDSFKYAAEFHVFRCSRNHAVKLCVLFDMTNPIVCFCLSLLSKI